MPPLEEPYPSAPRRAAKYEVWFNRCFEELDHKKMILLFSAKYAAKKAIEAVIGDCKFKWTAPHSLTTDNGVAIWCEQLQEIMEHEYTKDEKAWELPNPDLTNCRNFAINTPLLERDPDKTVAGQKGNKRSTPAEPKAPREKKESKPRADRSGLVSAGDIAKELDCEARDVRAALRKLKVPQPEVGWAWAEGKELDALRKKLKEAIK